MNDPVEQPLKVIKQQFQAAGGDVLNPSDSFNVKTFFSTLLSDPITKSQVRVRAPARTMHLLVLQDPPSHSSLHMLKKSMSVLHDLPSV